MEATLPVATQTPPARPPWEKPELFALRPDQPDHGYVVRGVRHGCSREELVARCRAPSPHVDVVWTPEFPRLLPPAEVPWLLDAVRQRARDNLRYNVRNGLTPAVPHPSSPDTLLQLCCHGKSIVDSG